MLFGSESKDHTPGHTAVKALLPSGKSIGLNICFDSCYPWILRDTARLKGVSLIALPNNDPESPHHFIAAVHSAFTTIRAAELGMPVIRADVRAYSLVVNSWGQIVVEAAPGVASEVGKVGPPHSTLARTLGDWFLYLCILGVAGYPISARLRQVSQKDKPSPS